MKVQDGNKLCLLITAACDAVTTLMLQNTWHEVEYRLDICRAPSAHMWRPIEEHENSLHLSLKFPSMFLSLVYEI
jgi:hypothetical protein